MNDLIASSPLAPAKPDPDKLRLTNDEASTEEKQMARLAYDSAARALPVSRSFLASGPLTPAALTESLEVLREQVAEVQAGNLKSAEATLVVQANTLDAIFNSLALKSISYLDSNPALGEKYLRLALKAQTQCRATLETLSEIKNPRVVFAKQANFSQGHQQINNDGVVPLRAEGKNVK